MLEKYWQVTSARDLVPCRSNWWKISQLLAKLISLSCFSSTLYVFWVSAKISWGKHGTHPTSHISVTTKSVVWVEATGAAIQRAQPLLGDPLAGHPLAPLSALIRKGLLLSLWICLQTKRVISFFNARGGQGVMRGSGAMLWLGGPQAFPRLLA